MKSAFTQADIDETVAPSVYTQSYQKKPTIEGVKLIPLSLHVGEDSDFVELVRVSQSGELEGLPGFKIRQISRSLQYPGAVKAWHLHLVQDELWFVPTEGHLIVGLWDLRKDSPTKGITTRLVLGKTNSSLLFIPKGVAHGSVNLTSAPVPIIYFVNTQFDPAQPDEHRISWDAKGAEFWQPQRD